MRAVIVIYLLFPITYEIALANKSKAELKAFGSDVLRKTIKSVNHINNIQLQTIAIQNDLKKMKNSYDFEIPNNPKILQLEDTLKSYKTNKGVIVCANLKKEKTIALMRSLRTTLTQKVNVQLEKYRSTLTDLHKTLQNIYESLQGKCLDQEINLCINNPQGCKITIQYPSDIKNGEEVMSSIDKVLTNLTDFVIKATINPTVCDQIQKKIYEPVMNCITHL